MSRHKDNLLAIGVVMVAAGGFLLANPFRNEPLWTQWLVGPMLFYLGLPLAIVGAVVHLVKGHTVSSDERQVPAKPHALH